MPDIEGGVVKPNVGFDGYSTYREGGVKRDVAPIWQGVLVLIIGKNNTTIVIFGGVRMWIEDPWSF